MARPVGIPLLLDWKGLKGSASKANRQMNQFQRQMTAQARAVQNSLRFTLVFTGIGALSQINKAFKGFEDTMLAVGAKAGVTGAAFDDLSNAVRGVAMSSTKTAAEVAEAAENMAKLGFTAGEIKDGLNAVILASEATGTSIERATEIIGRSTKALGLATDQFESMGDKMVATANGSAVSLESLGEAMSYGAGAFAGLNIQTSEGLALLGSLGNVGVEGSRGGNTLAQSVLALAKGMGTANENSDDLTKSLSKQGEVLAKYGLRVEKDATGNIANFMEILKTLIRESASVPEFIDVFGARAGRSWAMLASQGEEALDALTKKIADSRGVMLLQAEQMRTSLSKQWDLVASKWEEFNISLSKNGLAGVEQSLANLTSAMLDRMIPAAKTLAMWGEKLAYVLGALGVGLSINVMAKTISFALVPMRSMLSLTWSLVGANVALGASALRSAVGMKALTVAQGRALVGLKAMRAATLAAMIPFAKFLAIGGAVYAIFAVIYNEWDSITSGIRAALSWLGDAFAQLGKSLLHVLSFPFQLAYKLIKGFVTNFVGSVAWVISYFDEEMANSMTDGVNDFFTNTEHGAAQMAQSVKSTLGGIVTGTVGAVGAAVGAVGGFLGDVGSYLARPVVGGGGGGKGEFGDDDAEFAGPQSHTDSLVSLAGAFAGQTRGAATPTSAGAAASTGTGATGEGDAPKTPEETVAAWRQSWEQLRQMQGEGLTSTTSMMGQIAADFGVKLTGTIAENKAAIAKMLKNSADASKALWAAIVQDLKSGLTAMAKHSKTAAKVLALVRLREAIIAVKTGISNALALPPPKNFIYAAAVAAKGAATIKDIKASIKGQAHDGMTSIPETGSYVLKKGEMVATPRQNQQLTAFLNRQEQAAPAAPLVAIPDNFEGGFFNRDFFERLNEGWQEYQRDAGGGMPAPALA